MYLTLMEQGYKLHEIDEMDIKFYFELLQHKQTNKSQANNQLAKIDQVLF